ncbi:MAG: type III-B CRISPR module RAMP protein Cmr6 [Caldisericia bacterium]|jgi:CRISPR-associated protein Cmr6|nr:type III-B CRISPR module RAMP protein Cmr6 [Caldisericia bacterium]
MSIRFHVSKNKYFPRDTFSILSAQSIGPDNNFYFLFNSPIVLGEILPERIVINKEIEKFKWERNFLENIQKRRENLINLLKNNGFNVKNFQSICPWHLIIGLGGVHPQETSMTLHHIYGIPYIPGSAVKGVTKHWAVLKFAEQKMNKDNKSFEDAVEQISSDLEKGNELDLEIGNIKFGELIKIFGTQKHQGKVYFIDAYPVSDINLKIDIMNPHYPDYYSGKQPPADWQNPKPVEFLTVEKTTFRFYLISQDNSLLQKSEVLLKEALEKFGIGAKTSLGYGIFKI